MPAKVLAAAVLVGCVLYTAVAQAAISLSIAKNPDPAPGLESYTVTATELTGAQITVLSDIYLDGPCHQVWPFGSATGWRRT